jgi:hypothetical protein
MSLDTVLDSACAVWPDISFDMTGTMLAVRKHLEIVKAIVELIAVNVMNVEARWNWASLLLPDSSVETNSRLVVPVWPDVPNPTVVFDTSSTHRAPGTRSARGVKPLPSTQTGWSGVPVIVRPSARDNTRTLVLLRVNMDARTRRGPLRVITYSPAIIVSIGLTDPSPIVTVVPAIRHHPASCCGPRS